MLADGAPVGVYFIDETLRAIGFVDLSQGEYWVNEASQLLISGLGAYSVDIDV